MSSVIHDTFKYGSNFKIGHFCLIEEDVVVGNNVRIGNYVYLGKGTVVGNNTFIDSYAKSSGDNFIGDNVILRYNSTIARKVTIHDHVFVSPNVMTVFSDYDGLKSSSTVIEKCVFLGTSCVIGPNVVIGENTVIGALSYVNKSCLRDSIYYGSPARFIKSKIK